MTEHLPECLALLNDSTWDGDCICEALRACEQRVRRSLWLECYDAAMQTTESNYVWHEKRGYAAALDAARKAVGYRKTPCDLNYCYCDLDCCYVSNAVLDGALRAIDALKEKQ